MSRHLINANIFLRFLTKDDPSKAERCKQLLIDAADGKLSLYMNSLAVAEIVWVLERIYGWSRKEISQEIRGILEIPGIEIENRDIISKAFEFYRKVNIDFIDAYQSDFAEKHGLEYIYSYDKHFDLLPNIKRQEP